MKFYLTNTLGNIKQEYPELLQQKGVTEDRYGNLFIQIDKIRDLISLTKKYGDLVVGNKYQIYLKGGLELKIPKIEIYDDYRE